MSFSAHADAKGIMQLIRHCEPRNVMLVHGENTKMDFLKQKIMQVMFGWSDICYWGLLAVHSFFLADIANLTLEKIKLVTSELDALTLLGYNALFPLISIGIQY